MIIRIMVSILKLGSSSLRAIVDHASLPGPPGFRDSSLCSLSFSPKPQEDVAVCPTVNILLGFATFSATLHWPQEAADLGKSVFLILSYKVLKTGCFREKS